jgi:tRNA-specific 2-thiouridylase
VRAYAERLQLTVANKPDSHEICFVPDGRAGDFVERHLETGEPHDGEIVDSSGAVVGRHHGLHRYTVGQRKGLGVTKAEPLYVLRLDPVERRLVVGSRSELGRRELTASGVNWIAGVPPEAPTRVTARIRHRHADAPATVVSEGAGLASLVFDEPQLAVTPGQAVVFYDREDVVGGGWIE